MKEFYNYTDLQLDNEIWKDVVGYEEIYEVSNFGRIRTKPRVMYYDRNLGRGLEKKTVYPRIRKPKFNKCTGYLMVGLNGFGKSKNVTIHSMVARAFIKDYGHGKGSNDLCVNHIDGNKLNNNLENLEVITLKENIRHMFRTGLGSSHKIIYNNIYYVSKAEFRRKTGISERRMNKMIEKGEIKFFGQEG